VINKEINLKINGIEYRIFGTVRGLVSEGDHIEKIFNEFMPDTIMLGISKEDLDGLIHYIKDPFMVDISDYEIIWGLNLQRFGKVKLPVPSYLKAVEISQKLNLKILPIDLDEKEYSDLYTKKISTFMLLRHSLRKKRLYRKKFNANNPEEFSIMWDNEINKISGFREIEEQREMNMAKKINENNEGKRILVIVDYERMEGILKRLKF
jgi:hypothetical protein